MRTAPPPSEMMQQSNMCNGSEIIREANTSSTVKGSRYMASGFSAALARGVDRHPRQLRGRGAVLVHVAAGREGVATDEGAAIRHLELERSALAVSGRVQLRAQVSTLFGEEVRAVGDEDRVAIAVLDRRRGVLDVELEHRAPGEGAVEVVVRDAENLGHRHRVVDAIGAEAQQSVDVRLLHAAVVERPSYREAVMGQRIEVRGLRIVAQSDPHDGRRAVAHASPYLLF